MTHYNIPSMHNNIEPNMITISTNTNTASFISKTLQKYLITIKEQIDKYSAKWDNFKKYTNPYEYIHSVVPSAKTPVCKHKPLSRSYFKMIEMLHMLDIAKDYEDNSSINTFHLAEGPGGFIEAIVEVRENLSDKYYGMTLINDIDENVPGWRKSRDFLSRNGNVKIISGADGTGDLLNSDNLMYCYKEFANKMDIITGDGGFDFSIDFNKQETLATNLIFSQICFAITMQKHGGTFIIKIFDVFNKSTVDLIYILNCLYEKIYITKPHTSRYANSERYIVCRGFKLVDSTPFLNRFLQIYKNNDLNKPITNFLNIDYSYYFINKLEEINAILGQYQIENINSTINLIITKQNTDKLEMIKKNNIQKCINWCNKYKQPCNKTFIQTNNFVSQHSDP